jgi:hypothetical protein
MNGRFFLAVLAASLVAFLGGWLLFGVAMPDYYASNINPDAKPLMKKDVVMWAIALSNIAWALLVTAVIRRSGSLNFARGFLTGLWVSFLVIVAFDLSMYAFFDIYQFSFLVVDIFVSSIFWAIAGGVAGWILGMKRAD